MTEGFSKNACVSARSLMSRRHLMIRTPPRLKTPLCIHILLGQHSFSRYCWDSLDSLGWYQTRLFFTDITYFPLPNRTTTPMGNLTLVLLLSTWTTPSVLVLLLPRLLAPTRTQTQTRTQPSPLLAPLPHQAHEHKKTGRAPRRLLLPQPRYQRPRHRKNNPPPSLCLKPPSFWSTSCHVSS